VEKEHHFIDKYFKPLAIKSKQYPIGIGDDCAVIDSGERLITSKDISVSGVHFPKELDPYFVAYRSVATAISDIFAMGGMPTAYLLGITHPKPNEGWFESFSRGLNDFNEDYDVNLIGGDLTRGELNISVTAFGQAPGNLLTRTGANIGDLIFVSDLLGKGKKGLIDYRNNRDSDTNHYLKPQLPISLIPKLKQLVTSCIDVSDGLLIDLKRICSSSNVGAVINSRKDIYITDEHDLIAGDDYVLCFTAKKELKEKILALDSSIKIIGQIEEGTKVKVLNENNTEIKYKKDGWEPFESI
tara:strand:+ start:3225 stop:4121 length:897 start_codon:yes stop_codon:yes gene_type:complete